MARLRTPNEKTLARELEWLQMRRDGMTYEQIAATAGVTATRVNQVVQRARRRAVIDLAGDMKRDELARLDVLLVEALRQLKMDHVMVSHGKVIPDVVDEGAKMAALDRCLRIMERRAKLFGLDEPSRVRVETITTDDLDAQIAELEGQVALQTQSASPMS